jgi:D-3-phosphoglycerate dehydrogenase
MPKTLFIDATPEIALLLNRVLRPEDGPIAINMGPVTAAQIPELLAGYDTCIVDATYFDAATLARLGGLKHIVFLGTGAGSFIALDAARQAGVKVSTIKGYGDTAVAEHTVGLIFAAARNIAGMHEILRRGGWQVTQGMELKGKTVGVIGLGGIGVEVARLARGIGLEVIAFNRSPRPDAPVPIVALDALLAAADIVSLHLALNAETQSFLDRARLGRLRRGAILVNTARADLIEQEALIELLASGHIGHYATDVYTREPPAADDPLRALPRVTLTAHSGYNTPEAAMTMYRRAIDLAAGGW